MLTLRVLSVLLVLALLLIGSWAWAFTAGIVLAVLWHAYVAARDEPDPPPRRRAGMPPLPISGAKSKGARR